MDDGHTIIFHFTQEDFTKADAQRSAVQRIGDMVDHEYLPPTTDWYGRWRLVNSLANDHLIDRNLQRHGGSHTDILGPGTQDNAITESMGPIVNHDFEHLAASDLMIARTRECMLGALEAFTTTGVLPPGVANPESYRRAWAGYANLPKGADWLTVYRELTRTDSEDRDCLNISEGDLM
jgi:phthalate 4,5-dioxygenase oxygenase subunit